MDLWTTFLTLISQIITPVWNTLIQYIPLLFLALIPSVILLVLWMWQRNRSRNKPRVAHRLPDGPIPSGLHLPSPSIWPFIAPIGLFFVFLSLVLGGKSGPNLLWLALGLGIGAIAFAGWYWDARQEYAAVEAGDDHLHLVAETPGAPVPEVIPPGIHLPAPSGWPLLAPIGLFVAFLGLALSPVLIVAGLGMGLIALIGWTLDAGKEYVDVETDAHHDDPSYRDPERWFPKKLLPLFVGIAVFAIILASGNYLLSLLPKSQTGIAGGPTPTTEPTELASSVLGFDKPALYVPADKPFTITFENKQAGVPHNIEIFTDLSTTDQYYNGETANGPTTVKYDVPALEAGQYRFICSFHPNMQGTLFVQ